MRGGRTRGPRGRGRGRACCGLGSYGWGGARGAPCRFKRARGTYDSAPWLSSPLESGDGCRIAQLPSHGMESWVPGAVAAVAAMAVGFFAWVLGRARLAQSLGEERSRLQSELAAAAERLRGREERCARLESELAASRADSARLAESRAALESSLAGL